jgi:pantetheine-phosphate adenylyltransferase
MSERRVAIYPASFDPITNGHLDVIERATRLFDHLVIGVAVNVEKKGAFSREERIEMIREAVGPRKNLEIDVIEGLLVEYARRRGARIVIRGLRGLSDFEYEFEMALMNTHMYPDLETVFLVSNERWFYLSASRIRELATFGADIGDFVPPGVQRRMRARFGR